MKKYSLSKLPNGLTVITIEDLNSEIVDLTLWFRGGARIEPVGERGYTHLFEHMVFKGTKYRNEQSLRKAFDLAGAYQNAYTSRERLVYILKIPREKTKEMIALLSEMIREPLLSGNELTKEKEVIVQEYHYRRRTEKDRWGRDRLRELFAGHPLELDPLGDLEDIKRTKTKHLLDYHRRILVPNNAALIVSGGVSHAKTVAFARKFFGSWKSGTPIAFSQNPLPRGPRVFSVKSTQAQTSIAVYFLVPRPSLKEYIAAQMVLTYLCLGRYSALYRALRVKQQLVYSILANSDLCYSDAVVFSIDTDTTHPHRVLEIIGREISRLRTALDSKRFRDLKQQHINTVRRISGSGIVTEGVGSEWIASGELVSPIDIQKIIQSISLADVRKAANNIFSKQNLFVATLGEISEKDAMSLITKSFA